MEVRRMLYDLYLLAHGFQFVFMGGTNRAFTGRTTIRLVRLPRIRATNTVYVAWYQCGR